MAEWPQHQTALVCKSEKQNYAALAFATLAAAMAAALVAALTAALAAAAVQAGLLEAGQVEGMLRERLQLVESSYLGALDETERTKAEAFLQKAKEASFIIARISSSTGA